MAIKFSQFNLRTDHTSGMYLVGYDGNQNIHITVDNLFDDFINGTENTIAMFGTGGSVLADSILSQNVGATLLTVGGQLNVDAAATFDTSVTVTGDSTLNGNVTLGDASTDLITQTGTLYLNGPVKDTTDTLGVVDQILVSDATGELTFQDLLDTHVGSAEVVKVPVKNVQGSALVKGDPVYISGSVGASGRLEVQLADASNAAKMPAVGLLFQDLVNNEEGYVVITGKLRNLTTDPIDGVTPTEGDIIYVKPSGASGAALTTTKPVYDNFIQNMGKVGRVSTSNDGSLVLSSVLRSNDVPNLTPGRLWVGSTGNTIESQTLFVDEANGRLGIGLTDPNGKLDVATTTNTDVFNLRIHNLTSSSPQSTGILFNTGYHSASRGKGGLIYHYDTTNYGWNRGDFHFLQHTGNNAATPTLSDSVLVIKNTGNVGIGTTSPNYSLDIDGTLNTSGTAYFATTGTTSLAQLGGGSATISQFNIISTATGGSFIAATNTLALKANNTTGIKINNNGTVQFNQYGAGTFTGTATKTLAVDVNGNVIETAGVSVDGSGTANYVTKWFDTDTITDSVIYDDGTNVGIGTASPAEKLHVVGSTLIEGSSVELKVEGSGSYDTANITMGNAAKADTFEISVRQDPGDNYATLDYDGYSPTGTSHVRLGGDYLDFNTAGSSRMRINSTGNVGIATTNPLHRLQIGNGSGSSSLQVSSGVESALYLSTPNSTAQSVIGFGNDQFATINTRGRILYQSSTTAASNYMQFKVAFNEVMRLTNDSVGIGPTNPQSKLQVDGAVQVADDTDTASASKVGALRYRTSGNNSYVDMCMQTGASTYAWVNIVENNW